MFTHYRNTLSAFSRDTRLVIAAAAVVGFAYVGIFFLLFNLYLLRLGYEKDFIGLVIAAAQIGVVLFSIPAGSLGGRYGSRKMAIAGLGIITVGLGLLTLAEFIPAGGASFWIIFSYIVAWLGGALYLVNTPTFLMALTSDEERPHAFSVRRMLVPLAGFAGSIVGGYLPVLFASWLGVSSEHPAPYRYALFIAAILMGGAFFSLLATGEAELDRPRPRKEARGPVPAGAMAIMGLVAIFLYIGRGSFYQFFNVYLDDGLHLSSSRIGWLFGVGQLLGGLAALATPLAVKRLGKGRTVTLGILGMAFSLLPLALIFHWGAAGLGFIAANMLYTFTEPAFNIYQQELVVPSRRAMMSGAIIAATSLGTAAIALAAGSLITGFGYAGLFLTGAVAAVVSAVLFWGYAQMRRNPEPKLLAVEG